MVSPLLADEAAEPDAALDCVINPSVVADLGSSVPGVLSEVRVDRSDFVDRGAVVAELESGAESATVELARARAGMTAEVDLRRVNAAFGRRQHERSKDLFERKVLSTNEMDERTTESRVASLQLRQALDEQRLAGLELQRAEEILNRRVIHSPISGVVMESFKSVGEYVDDQPVVRVAQLDPLHVEVIVPVEQLGEVHPGMQAEVWADAVSGERWQATVSRVDRVADVASGTYGVRLALPNPEYRIPAGLRCRMSWLPPGETPVADAASAGSGETGPGSATAPSVPSSTSAGAPVGETPGDHAPATAAAAAKPAATGPLTAVADVVDETEPVAIAASEVVHEVEPIQLPTCHLVGPFAEKERAVAEAEALRQRGLEARLRQMPVERSAGFQVVSEPLPDRAAAIALQRRLGQAGYNDSFIKRRSEPPYELSLGVYRGPISAQRQAGKLRAAGFKVLVQPWTKSSEQSFITIRGPLDDTDRVALEALPLPGPDVAASGIPCDRLAER